MLDSWGAGGGGGNVLKRRQHSHLAISHVCPTHTPRQRAGGEGSVCLDADVHGRQFHPNFKASWRRICEAYLKLQVGAGETKQEQHDTNPPKDAALPLSTSLVIVFDRFLRKQCARWSGSKRINGPICHIPSGEANWSFQADSQSIANS